MTQLEAKEIIRREMLKKYNWFEDHPLRENQVGISVHGDKWVVYVTDERASVVSESIIKFNDKSHALDNFIKRLRTDNILF